MYHNPHNLVNYLRAISNKIVINLNNLCDIKFIWRYELVELMFLGVIMAVGG
ncbi:conserved protein of unknown function [Limnospira indica PCC 8005]|uniref:Uncharacterized protein n=1 Tax=Limnospira indica PCC 8005 TaxID=376219 RepID=A0A9P1P0J7_9CYAN|nr:conserved protein of unknown function [Limnospira indica PCC 8005]